jgi:hypothetical protein
MASLHGIAQSHQLMGKRNKKLQIYGGKQREILARFGEDIDAAVALVDRSLVLNPSFALGWGLQRLHPAVRGNPISRSSISRPPCALALVTARQPT